MLVFALALLAAMVVFSVAVGDWTDLGEHGLRCQIRARVALLVLCAAVTLLTSIGFGLVASAWAGQRQHAAALISALVATLGLALVMATLVLRISRPGSAAAKGVSVALPLWALCTSLILVGMIAAAAVV